MTPDQAALVGLAEEILRGRTSNEQLAAVEVSPSRLDEALWSELAAAGLLGIAVPERFGGAGLGLTEVCLVLEQLGRRLALVPLWETSIGALAVARADVGDLLSAVVAGRARLALPADLTSAPQLVTAGGSANGDPVGAVSTLTGAGVQAADGAGASAALVRTPGGLFLADLTTVTRSPLVTTTHALAADLTFAASPAVFLGGLDASERCVAEARLGLAALMLGVADEGVREAASYVSQREQFGRPLATFQAVSQQLGDAYCDVLAMRATLWQAVWAVQHRGNARQEVDVAVWWACDAGLRVQQSVQHVHGGIGADITYPVHRRLLWALHTDSLLGGARRQLVRLGRDITT